MKKKESESPAYDSGISKDNWLLEQLVEGEKGEAIAWNSGSLMFIHR